MFGTVGEVFASQQLGFPILSFMIFIPLIGAVGIFFMKRNDLIPWVALGTTGVDFLLSIVLFATFTRGIADMQFVEKADWIAPLGTSYHLGIDGISVLLVILTTFLSVLMVLFSWELTYHVKQYMIAILVLETTLVGVFSALDLVLFFVFWEVELIPMYFLIKVWGGENRDYAALKFVLYTLCGSVLMLVGIILIYLNYHEYALSQGLDPAYSFDLLKLFTAPMSPEKQVWVFLFLFFGFAFKVPMFPFHTWLPDAHVEAPVAGSVVLAGVLLKMGTYGFVRFSLPLLPDASREFVPFMTLLALIGIVYGGFLALAQEDMKKLVAYSSISHLGFVMLGVFALNYQGIQGGLLQMINHGISTAGLFLSVGFLYERRHTRLIADYGGLAHQIPIFCAFYMIITLSSMGMPGTNGFVGEFMILVGAFKRHWQFAVFGVMGLLLGAAYLLWLYQRVVYGRAVGSEHGHGHGEGHGQGEGHGKMADLNLREVIIVASLSVLIFWIGFYPSPFLRIMDGSVKRIAERVDPSFQQARQSGTDPSLLPLARQDGPKELDVIHR